MRSLIPVTHLHICYVITLKKATMWTGGWVCPAHWNIDPAVQRRNVHALLALIQSGHKRSVVSGIRLAPALRKLQMAARQVSQLFFST